MTAPVILFFMMRSLHKQKTLSLPKSSQIFFLSIVRYLIILNSCLAAVPGKTAYTGVARNLVAIGVPYVIAMQNYISNKSAKLFSKGFYRALESGDPVWKAVSQGRGILKHRAHPTVWNILRLSCTRMRIHLRSIFQIGKCIEGTKFRHGQGG